MIIEGGAVQVLSCTFIDNGLPGLMIYSNAEPTVVSCLFAQNSYSGYYSINGDGQIINCLFRDNDCEYQGGGLFLADSNPDVINCTVLNNRAMDGSGGGIHCDASSHPQIINTIVRGNTPHEIAGNPTVTYSNVAGGYSGEGNIDADPAFVDGANHDYRPDGGSPCIDAGNGNALPVEIVLDLLGAPRFVDDPYTQDTGPPPPPVVDIGACEYQGDATGLKIAPAHGFDSEGPNGGPFLPESLTYTLKSYEAITIEYAVSDTATWLDVDTTGGTLDPGESVDILVSINEEANDLSNGHYEASIEFVNETTHDGDTTRPVTLVVGVPIPMIIFNLDDDPGWTMDGQWAFGQPAGGGGTQHGYPDPTSGATGDNVLGVNLNGDYTTSPGGPWYVTTGALDCSNLMQVSLHFQRWLNSDFQPFVTDTVEASTNGSDWMLIWENSSGEIVENIWSEHAYDIADLADGAPTLYLRWGYEIGSGAWAYSGWNIDDIAIWGVPMPEDCPADFDGDGDVDTADLLHLLGAWGTAGGDVDGDGDTDTADLLALLAAWGECP
jgi:hypothetical protein